MSKVAFSGCFLLVPELQATRAFYESVLGLQPKDEDEQSVRYDVVGTELKLQADYSPEVFEAFNLDRPSGEDRGDGVFLVLDLEEDIETIHQRVADSEGEACFEPRSVEWLDGRMFIARDPNGYTLEIR